MKNNGYTLLELLGVIVILALLVTLVFPSVINFIKKSNDKVDDINNSLVINAAEDYINDNSSELYLTSGVEYCISVNLLIGKGYLNDVLEDKTLYSSKSVKVSYNEKINYEIIDSNDCSICKLVSGNYNEIGAKYQCKVKDNMETGYEDGYYFYLLSRNISDGTINLIMDRNICQNGTLSNFENKCTVAWYSEEEAYTNTKGPVTAMDYIYKATKDWDNVPNIKIDYEDENMNTANQKGNAGYGTIKTINGLTQITENDATTIVKVLLGQDGYTNLKARLPKYDEVYNIGCRSAVGSCPLWISNYLKSSTNVVGEEIKNISGLYGYWMLSSRRNSELSPLAWYVRFDGNIANYDVSNTTRQGVRPVITVKNIVVLD